MKNIYLETFGCQMNVLDSELVETQLRSLGYGFTTDTAEADVIIYNTCSVRQNAEEKVKSRLGMLKKRLVKQPDLVVGVIGCMAEREGVDLFKRFPHLHFLCGPSELDRLPSLLNNALITGEQQSALAGNTSRRSQTLDHAKESGEGGSDGLENLDLSRSFSSNDKKYQAYIRIVRGCNKFCTYCVVPYTRGPEISRSPGHILEEARKLLDAGCLEITLLGQTVNHYIYEDSVAISTPTGPAKRQTTFAELLQMLHDKLPSLQRLRFITSYPADFGDDILRVIAQSPRICRYLHIPAQCGSTRILKMMNRGYTAESYMELIGRIKKIVPEMVLAGDIIVGFPTETDDDYAATRTMLESVRYKNCFIFKYSPRPGTTAIRRYPDDVPTEVKRYRNNDLLSVQNRITNELNVELIGKTVDVLCEGPSGWKKPSESVVAGVGNSQVQMGPRLASALQSRNGETASQQATDALQLTGRTSFDQIVVFDGTPALEGSIVRVRITNAHGLTLFGEVAPS